MRILYFHQHFSTPKGAAGIRSYEMARALVAKGHQVTMVCGSFGAGSTGLSEGFVGGKRSGVVDGIDVIEFNLTYSNTDGFLKRSGTFVKFALSSVGVALRQDYDLLFATSTPLTAGIPGIFGRWLRRKPFVFEVRDLWPELPKAMGVITNPIILAMMKVLEIATYKSAHRCIGLSPGIVDGIAKGGVPCDRVAMVSNGCDMDYFQSLRADPWRPDGVSPTDFLAVFTGTHGLANGLNAVIDAALLLHQRGRNDIKIAFVGDGMEKPKLEARAQHLGLTNVVFVSRVDKFQLAGMMASADMGIQCLANVPAFYYGTSPNKFFDYLAAGLPVICNYPGWIADLITQNACGMAVPAEDAVAFANALERASEDRAALKSMAQNSKMLAEKSFDRRILSEKWCDWVLGAARTSGP